MCLSAIFSSELDSHWASLHSQISEDLHLLLHIENRLPSTSFSNLELLMSSSWDPPSPTVGHKSGRPMLRTRKEDQYIYLQESFLSHGIYASSTLQAVFSASPQLWVLSRHLTSLIHRVSCNLWGPAFIVASQKKCSFLCISSQILNLPQISL